MSLDYSDGGLRAPNIELMPKSLKLAWIARLLKKRASLGGILEDDSQLFPE